MFLSRTQVHRSTCVLASKSVAAVTLEEVKPCLTGVEVSATYYRGGLYNPTMSCEIREFDELDD